MSVQILQIPLEQLDPAPWNPRAAADPAGLDDLTSSVRAHGVLQSLLVRATKGDRYQIIAGHRRAAAARLAELKTAPCQVLDVDDEAAQTKAIVEQLQRESLTPLDEARAFRVMLGFKGNGTGQTAASIGKDISKPERYVWEHVRLLELIPDAQQLLASGRVTLQHANILSRLTAAEQTHAIDPASGGLFTGDGAFEYEDRDRAKKPNKWDGMKAVSVREFDAWVKDHVRFNPVQAAAAAPLDFGPVAEQVQTATAQPGRGKKVIQITHDTYVQPDAKDPEGQRTFCASSWKRADGQQKSKTCDHAVLGVIVVGPDYGQAFPVCVNKDCDTHWAAEKKAREKQSARAGGGSSQRARDRHAREDEKRRQQQLQEAGERKAWDALAPTITKAIGAAIKTKKAVALADLVLNKLAGYHPADERKAVTQLLGAAGTAEAIVRHAALMVLRDEIADWRAYREFPSRAKQFGVDVVAIRRANQPKAEKPSTTEPGTCRECGCTEDEACEEGCGWADNTKTLCASCVGKSSAAIPAKTKATKKTKPAAKAKRGR